MVQAPRVLIVDDHPLFRDALETALECAYPAGAAASHASSLSDALARLQADDVDLVLLDLNLGDSAEFEGLTRLRAARPDCPVVVVSATETPEAFEKARRIPPQEHVPGRPVGGARHDAGWGAMVSGMCRKVPASQLCRRTHCQPHPGPETRARPIVRWPAQQADRL